MKHWIYLAAFCSAALVDAQECGIVGQVFFADTVDRTITLTTDSDDLAKFSYDGTAKFVHAGLASNNGMLPEQLNNGDRLCVGVSAPLVVTVTPRQEIEAEQRTELAAWQVDSLYGTVSGLDRKARRITLDVPAGGQHKSYSVDVRPDASYWSFPKNPGGLGDAAASSLDRISFGDTLYVRGTAAGSQGFTASLIISGGFRSFAATIETMETVEEQLHVRLVLSGNTRTVHVHYGELYAIGQEGNPAHLARHFHSILPAELQPGDTVLILGTDDGQGSVQACALIAGFSPFGVLPPDQSQQMRWIFDNVSLGDPFTPVGLRRPAGSR